jgi:hypothetical protein
VVLAGILQQVVDRRDAEVQIGPEPGVLGGRPGDDRVLRNARVADGLDDLARVAVELHQRVEVVALARFALELQGRVVGLVQLQKRDVHEERFLVPGMRLDVLDRALALPVVDRGEVGVAEVLGDPPGRLPRLDFDRRGDYVSCVAHAAPHEAVRDGTIEPEQKARFLKPAARGN